MNNLDKTPEFNPASRVKEIEAEINQIRQKLIPAKDDRPTALSDETSDKNLSRQELITTFEKTAQIVHQLDHDCSRHNKPKESINGIYSSLDSISRKIGATPISEQIAIQTTHQLCLKLDDHFQKFLKDTQITSAEKKILEKFYQSQLAKIYPGISSTDEA